MQDGDFVKNISKKTWNCGGRGVGPQDVIEIGKGITLGKAVKLVALGSFAESDSPEEVELPSVDENYIIRDDPPVTDELDE